MINKCLLKVAHFAAQLEQYPSAIEKFERVASDSADNQLTKWSIKEYFLKAGLCCLCTAVKCSNHNILLAVLIHTFLYRIRSRRASYFTNIA
jgi:alpha-soluble NSF attachment protein